MKNLENAALISDGAMKGLKQAFSLLSLPWLSSILFLMLLWNNPLSGQSNCVLACQGAQVSLGADCTAEVSIEMIGDTSQCPGGGFIVYVITLAGDTLPGATVTEAEIGLTLKASLVDTISGNSCWSYITVEDKKKPTLVCVDDTLSCLDMLVFPEGNFQQSQMQGEIFANLASTADFALFTAAGAFNNIGAGTVVTGDVGTHVGAFNAFPPGILIGDQHVANGVSAQAAADVLVAYSYFASLTCGAVIGTTLGNNQVLTPNIYCTGAASTLNGNLILDAENDPNAVFIFQIGGALSTSTFSNVTLINGASLCNVYWQINGAFSLGNGSVFNGTIIANGALSFLDGATLMGRGLTTAGAISLMNNTVTIPSLCNTGPNASDNCSDVEIILLDETSELLCDTFLIKRVTRTYLARDESGNESDPCIVNFYLERIDFSLIEFPDSLTVADGDALLCDEPFADADQDGIPDPQDDGLLPGTGVPTINGVPVFPDFIGLCNASVNFEDIVLPSSGCVRKIMRVWTVNEWHCMGETDTLYVQLIEIVDDAGPTIVCPASFTQTTTGHSCTANIWVPAAVVTDNCSAINSVTVAYPGGFKNQNGGFYVSLPVGYNVLTYTAYDDCYNSSQCTVAITVQDLTPPVAACDEHTIVSLTLGGRDGLTKVDASVFDNGSYDACGPVTFRARRMDFCIDFDWTTEGAGMDEIPNGIVNSRDHGTVHRPLVPFSCCDAGAGPIMIELEVTDASKNVNYCMVEVEVQDKIAPQITCPSDITISCEYPLNLDDLSDFGDVVGDQHDVQTWCIYDPTNDNANANGFVCGVDGVWVDNCDIDISVENVPEINNCGVGKIYRHWRAEDANGSDECTQVITVINFQPIVFRTIDWPDDYHGLECAEGTDPHELEYPYNEPVINEDACDLIGVTYDDVVFPIVDGACFKILRTWKVIEWCLYEQYGGISEGYNYWEHTQVLKVINQFGPEFITDQPTIERCNNFDCGGIELELIQRAEDDCTSDELLHWSYAVDANNDNTIDIGPFTGLGAVIDASDSYPLGYHRIIYSFEDRCGNRTVREQYLDLKSCKAPVPVCINGLSTDLMPVDTDGDGTAETGMVTIWASDFNASSYHPCGFPFELSLSPDTTVKSLIFTCEHAGQGQVPVNLYVTDALGNQAYCETYIIIQDNMDVCPEDGNLTGTITGNVSTETSDNILDVAVQIAGSSLLPINTNQTGMFTFPSMPVGGNYVISPAKSNDYKNGVSTLDLVEIQKHLLGIKDLESPFKMVAADANNSESITAIDLIELRKLILGIYTELPNNASWRFVDKTYSFPDPYNPWMQDWPEQHVLSPLSIGMNHADFYGIKIGDVNNTVKANASSIVPRGSDKVLELVIEDATVEAGTSIEIPVYAGSAYLIEGMQFTLDVDQSLTFKNVIAGQMDVTSENFAFLNGKILTSSWNAAEGVQFNDAQPLFTLVMDVSKRVSLSEVLRIAVAPTHPEAYAVNRDMLGLKLSFRGAEHAVAFELLQNEPNPFSSKTTIGFLLPDNGQATLTVFDLDGRKLLDKPIAGLKGLNKVEISRSQLGAQGMVYYQVQYEGYTATKKMLLL